MRPSRSRCGVYGVTYRSWTRTWCRSRSRSTRRGRARSGRTSSSSGPSWSGARHCSCRRRRTSTRRFWASRASWARTSRPLGSVSGTARWVCSGFLRGRGGGASSSSRTAGYRSWRRACSRGRRSRLRKDSGRATRRSAYRTTGYFGRDGSYTATRGSTTSITAPSSGSRSSGTRSSGC